MLYHCSCKYGDKSIYKICLLSNGAGLTPSQGSTGGHAAYHSMSNELEIQEGNQIQTGVLSQYAEVLYVGCRE